MNDESKVLDYDRPPKGQQDGTAGCLWSILGVICALVVVWQYVKPPHLRPRDLTPITICASNMYHIGVALEMHRSQYGQDPSRVASLVNDEIISDTEVFVCPCSEMAPAMPDASGHVDPDEFDAHNSYVIALGLPANMTGTMVRGFCMPGRHSQQWINVLLTEPYCSPEDDLSAVKAQIQKLNDFLASQRAANEP